MQFIVLEGLDGAGKSTQVLLIHDYFNQRNIPTKFIHFPRTEQPHYGDLVARFLRGEFGRLNEVNPYLVALLYAGDRLDAADTIRQWLLEGYVVIADRYVFSNIAYQCAKTETSEDKEKLKNWILDFEFGYYKLPAPTAHFFLDVPFGFTLKSLSTPRSGAERDYLKGNSDIHEQDLKFQERVRLEYLDLCNSDPTFIRIDCSTDTGHMLEPEKIFAQLKATL